MTQANQLMWMTHPDLPGDGPGGNPLKEVTVEAFGVWRTRGWQEAPPPRDPYAVDPSELTFYDIAPDGEQAPAAAGAEQEPPAENAPPAPDAGNRRTTEEQ